MAFQYLTNIPLERAKRDYEDILISEGFRGEAEEIPAVSSLGRTTASPVYAKICSPHYPASAMDCDQGRRYLWRDRNSAGADEKRWVYHGGYRRPGT